LYGQADMLYRNGNYLYILVLYFMEKGGMDSRKFYSPSVSKRGKKGLKVYLFFFLEDSNKSVKQIVREQCDNGIHICFF